MINSELINQIKTSDDPIITLEGNFEAETLATEFIGALKNNKKIAGIRINSVDGNVLKNLALAIFQSSDINALSIEELGSEELKILPTIFPRLKHIKNLEIKSDNKDTIKEIMATALKLPNINAIVFTGKNISQVFSEWENVKKITEIGIIEYTNETAHVLKQELMQRSHSIQVITIIDTNLQITQTTIEAIKAQTDKEIEPVKKPEDELENAEHLLEENLDYQSLELDNIDVAQEIYDDKKVNETEPTLSNQGSIAQTLLSELSANIPSNLPANLDWSQIAKYIELSIQNAYLKKEITKIEETIRYYAINSNKLSSYKANLTSPAYKRLTSNESGGDTKKPRTESTTSTLKK